MEAAQMCSQGNTGNGHRKKQQRQKNRYPTFPLVSLLHTTEPAPMQFNMNRRKQKKKRAEQSMQSKPTFPHGESVSGSVEQQPANQRERQQQRQSHIRIYQRLGFRPSRRKEFFTEYVHTLHAPDTRFILSQYASFFSFSSLFSYLIVNCRKSNDRQSYRDWTIHGLYWNIYGFS